MRAEDKKFGVTICYEDLFPEISRTFTRAGADFLVNLTNDGWYERSSAVFQHLDFSRYRAVENRRALVRVTNTGVTAVFSPTGETVASLPPFEEGTLVADAVLGGPETLYTEFGDWPAWVCVLALALLGGWSLCRKKSANASKP
jgi:apolipoprotein N-acyltransferase